MAKDYYKILGVDKGASQDEIKKAFRKLAQQHHPDKPGGDEAKFKEANEAYSTLSDDKKRAQYDQFGSGFSGGGGGASGFDGFDFSGFSQQGTGTHVEFDLNDILNSVFRGNGGFTRMRKGADIAVDITVEFRESILGSQKKVSVVRNDGSREEIHFTVPPGIDSGEMLRLSDKGESVQDGRPGDLYIRIHVTPHGHLRKEGVNLVMNMPIKFSEAILGAKYNVDTLEETVSVKIPKGITHGEILRIKGKGVPINGRGNGDLLIRIQIPTPENLSKKAKQAVEDLRDEGF